MSDNNDKVLTKSNGQWEDNDNISQTTTSPAFSVLSDTIINDKLSHFNRERIPERVVHARGAGAYGTFVCTNNEIGQYTMAKPFCNAGKETEVFVRFSTVGGEKGSADTARDPRGFAVKFYTEEGNYDIVGNNTPVFFIRDAIKFPDFIHTQKRNPITNLPDPNAVWDFFSLNPISMNQMTRLFTDNGTPDGFRHMNGFGNHSFMWYRDPINYVWVKYHFISNQGIKNLTAVHAEKLSGANPNYSTADLYDSIKAGNYPSWDLCVQILSPKQAANYRYNIFDVSKIIYEEDFPLIKVGRMTLNRLPHNFFNEVEQSAFCPGNFINGIASSPDKMLNARSVMYSDAQRYRIGTNFNQLSVNKPKIVNNFQRDGLMSALPQPPTPSSPNYFPNSFSNIKPDLSVSPPPIGVEGCVARHPDIVKPIDYEQPRRYYEELTSREKDHLIENIANSLGGANVNIQYRQCAVCFLTCTDYGTRLANSLQLNLNKVMYLASMSEDERLKKTLPNMQN